MTTIMLVLVCIGLGLGTMAVALLAYTKSVRGVSVLWTGGCVCFGVVVAMGLLEICV